MKEGTKFMLYGIEYKVLFVTEDGYYALFEDSAGHKDIMTVESLETQCEILS